MTYKQLYWRREHYKKTIEALGGKVVNSVSKNTNYLLAGNKAGSKLNKAENLNLPQTSVAPNGNIIQKTPKAIAKNM